MTGRAYLGLTAALTVAAAWLTNRLGALLLDFPPTTSAEYPADLVGSYVLSATWDPRTQFAALLVASVVVLAAMTAYTNRDERRLKREVRGREFGDARWATPEERAAFAHTATVRRVPATLPRTLKERLAMFARAPLSFLRASLGMNVRVKSPRPEWCDQLSDDNIVLSSTARLQLSKIPNPLVERNKHVYIIGGSGSGKTFNFVGPNLLQLYGSYLVLDPKGDTLKTYAPFFVAHGYKLKVVDLKSDELRYSMHYNPLLYLTGSTSILTLVNLLVENTSGEGASESGNADFFVKAEKQLYMALIGYLHYFYRDQPQYRTFSMMVSLLQLAKEDTDSSGANSILDRIILGRSTPSGSGEGIWSFREWIIDMYGGESAAQASDEWFVITQYKGFKATAGSPETEASVISSCNVRMSPFSVGDVKTFFSSDELDLERIGEERTAFFLVMSDTDSTFNFILAMLLYQFFDLNTAKADANPGSHCTIPVMCILDELANVGKIPDLDIKIATLRSRWINLVPILQNSTQLKKWYKDNAPVIEGNCDTMIYLGRADEETNKKVSEMCGKRTIPVRSESVSKGSHGSVSVSTQWQAGDLISAYDLGHNPEAFAGDECLVFVKNSRPVKDVKYKTTDHPRYHELAECGRLDVATFGRALQRRREARVCGHLSGKLGSDVPLGGELCSLTDHVSCYGLVEDETYSLEIELKTCLPDGSDPRPVKLPDDEPLRVRTEITVTGDGIETPVSIAVPTKELHERVLVATETLRDSAGELWCSHEGSPETDGVHFPAISRRVPIALADRPRLALSPDGSKLVATFSPAGLIDQRTYTLAAELSLVGRGSGPEAKGDRVSSSRAAFVYEAGVEVDVALDVDASRLSEMDARVSATVCEGGVLVERGTSEDSVLLTDVIFLSGLTPHRNYRIVSELRSLDPRAATDRGPALDGLGKPVAAATSIFAPVGGTAQLRLNLSCERDALPGGLGCTVQTLSVGRSRVDEDSWSDIDALEHTLSVPAKWDGAELSSGAISLKGRTLTERVGAPSLSTEDFCEAALEVHSRGLDGSDLGVVSLTRPTDEPTALDETRGGHPAAEVSAELAEGPLSGRTLVTFCELTRSLPLDYAGGAECAGCLVRVDPAPAPHTPAAPAPPEGAQDAVELADQLHDTDSADAATASED
jgi:type IV secretion system protein VirD4